jgi:hypothetical protein
MKRVLWPGGVLEIDVPNPDCGGSKIDMVAWGGAYRFARMVAGWAVAALGFNIPISTSLDRIHQCAQFDEESPEGAGPGNASEGEGKPVVLRPEDPHQDGQPDHADSFGGGYRSERA